METLGINDHLTALRSVLTAERDRIALDMRDYPTPIPACDADFNTLIDERIRLADAVVRLDALRDALLDRTEMASVWTHHPHGPGGLAGNLT